MSNINPPPIPLVARVAAVASEFYDAYGLDLVAYAARYETWLKREATQGELLVWFNSLVCIAAEREMLKDVLQGNQMVVVTPEGHEFVDWDESPEERWSPAIEPERTYGDPGAGTDPDRIALAALRPGERWVRPVFDASIYGDGKIGGSTRLIVSREADGTLTAVTEREQYGRDRGVLAWQSDGIAWRQDERGWMEPLVGLTEDEAMLWLSALDLMARSQAASHLADYGLRKEAA